MAEFHYKFRIGDLVRASSKNPYRVMRELEEPMEVVKRHKDGTVQVRMPRSYYDWPRLYTLYDDWLEVVRRETCELPKQNIFEALYT